jgi:aminoglycoside 6'-N-acetyltransferase
VLVEIPTLHGEGLIVQPVRPEHAERLLELRATPGVARWWDPPPDGWPLEAEPDLHALAVLVEGKVAGYIQFWEEPDPDARHADVDIFLGPDAQDRGLGTEAMRTVIGYLTGGRGHHRITLGTSPDNARAIRSYEKVGFRRVGLMRKAARSHRTGEWEDELLMEYVV